MLTSTTMVLFIFVETTCPTLVLRRLLCLVAVAVSAIYFFLVFCPLALFFFVLPAAVFLLATEGLVFFLAAELFFFRAAGFLVAGVAAGVSAAAPALLPLLPRPNSFSRMMV